RDSGGRCWPWASSRWRQDRRGWPAPTSQGFSSCSSTPSCRGPPGCSISRAPRIDFLGSIVSAGPTQVRLKADAAEDWECARGTTCRGPLRDYVGRAHPALEISRLSRSYAGTVCGDNPPIMTVASATTEAPADKGWL